MEIKFYKTYFEIEKNHWLMKVRREIVFDILDKFLFDEDSKISKKVLDFGSGSGFLVGELQKKGIDAHGVDMSEEAIKYGTSRGIKNLSSHSEKLDFPSNSFDCVITMDVLEHTKEERPYVDELVRVLKPGGICVVTVPMYMFLWGVQDEVAYHYRRYNMEGLVKVFSIYPDLKIVKKSYFNTFLFLPIATVRLISRVFNLKKRQSDFDLNNSFLNFIFYWIFRFERFFLAFMNFPFGVSMLLVLKKDK